MKAKQDSFSNVGYENGSCLYRPNIVIVRTAGAFLDYTTYNCQEVGLAKALAKKGYQVSVVLGGLEERHSKVPVGNIEIDVYYLRYKAINQSISIFVGWKKLLERLKPDVVQVHEVGMFMSWFVAKWAKRKGIRCVLVQGSYSTTHKPVFKQLENSFNITYGKALLKMVDAVGCKTLAARDYLEQYVMRDTILTPIGLDEDRFCNISINEDIRHKYGLKGKKVLLFVGRLVPLRHPLLLLKVLQQLPPDYSLLIVGDGPLKEEMHSYIANNKISNAIMVGKLRQEELPAVYHAADLLLSPADSEIFGMALLEAMYFGVPVISSSTAGANTIVDEAAGVVLPSFDVIDWKNQVLEICENPEKLAAMKNQSAQLIRENYVWDKAVVNFEKLYNIKQ